MKQFKTGDTLVATKNASNSIAWKSFGLDRAYSSGDTFKVYRESIEDSSGTRLIIWHPILKMELEVNKDNFELLADKYVSWDDHPGYTINKLQPQLEKFGLILDSKEVDGKIWFRVKRTY